MAENSAHYAPSTHQLYEIDTFSIPRSTASTLRKSMAVVPTTPQEWNVHRVLITRLYRDMELPLKEVQRIMETDYNFKAT